MLDRTIPPPYRETDKFEIVKAETSLLDNGIPLHVIRTGKEDVIRFEIIFKSGHWYEPQNGISYFTTKLLTSGTSGLSAKEIEEQIAYYGSFIDLTTGYDRSTLTVYTLSKHLPKLLPLVKEIVIDSIFPEEELESLKNISLQTFKVNLEKTGFLASMHFRKHIFGNVHPYSRIIDEDAIKLTSHDAVKDFYSKKFTSQNADIIISGNGREDFYNLINTEFGKEKWGNYTSEEKNFSINNPISRKFSLKKVESVQSSIRIGLNVFPITHPDYFKVNLLIEILGGYFGSRLMKNIREEKGYTYGINSSFHSLKNAGYLVIGTDVNNEYTSSTINEIYKEINILKSEPVNNEELSTVRNYLFGNFIGSLSTPFSLADKFKTIYYHDLDYSFYNQYIHSLKTITSSNLKETAEKYFDQEKMIEVIVGG